MPTIASLDCAVPLGMALVLWFVIHERKEALLILLFASCSDNADVKSLSGIELLKLWTRMSDGCCWLACRASVETTLSQVMGCVKSSVTTFSNSFGPFSAGYARPELVE